MCWKCDLIAPKCRNFTFPDWMHTSVEPSPPDPDFEEAAGEQWLVLLPDKWNRQVHYGWRYDPREREAARAERERQEALERAAECPGRQKAPKQKK